MDWLKLFALLVAVASVYITADAPKKKIRIHLPQKVKHIHHHKKIYITNHPASSQYAPAFMPSAEGTVAVPTNVAMPAVASVLNTVDLFNESPTRLPGISSAASKLLPLYRARGYYGPTPSEWDDQDYDLANAVEQIDESNLPIGFTAPAVAPTGPSNYSPQRVKIIKINEPTRKKVGRKNKPKRVPVRTKPQPPVDDELPVTTFHEQFYSDLDSSGTIRKVKKPQRVEKIIDGDTEHIHTYSEEHIHKLVFGDGVKVPRVVGIDAIGGMSALAPTHSLTPLKNHQPLIAIPPETLTGFTAIGSMSMPSNLEYSAYNPREVTHDHIFHDHGEIPPGLDLSKDHLTLPPRVTYSSQGLRIGVGGKFSKTKYPQKYFKIPPKPSPISDFSYYEQIYAPYNKVRNLQNDDEVEDTVVPSFKLKSKGNIKPGSLVPAIYGKQVSNYRQPQASASSPYSVSSTVVHEYKPKHYSNPAVGLTKPNKNIYSYPNNNYEYDAYPSSSNVYPSENYSKNYSTKKGKKKSVSTQNISFGGLAHQTNMDHLQDSAPSSSFLNAVVPTAFDNSFDQSKIQETVHPSAFTIRQVSPVHPYYTAMAIKALHSGDQLSVAEASNDNYQYAEAPSPSTTANEAVIDTTASPMSEYSDVTSSETITETTNYDTRSTDVINEQSSEVISVHNEPRLKIITIKPKKSKLGARVAGHSLYKSESDSVTGRFKYGDKI